jgi:hypothetical protein
MLRFGQFLKAAGTYGGGSVLLAILLFGISIGEHIKDKNVSVGWLEWVALVFFCFGAYKAWDNTDKKLRDANTLLDETKPRIEGKIWLGYLDAGKLHEGQKWDDVATGCTITLYIDATNLNNQEAWFRAAPELKITMAGREYEGVWKKICSQLLSVNDPALTGDKMIRDFFDQRYLDSGFSMVKGRPAVGWLMFYVEAFDKNMAFGRSEILCNVIVALKDTLSVTHPLDAELQLKVNLICPTKDLLPKQQQ